MAKHGSDRSIDPAEAAADLELFSSFIRSQEQQERDAKAAARDERRKADALTQLTKAKEDAAAEVKRLRSREGVPAEQKAAADEAYRLALAAVVAAETGETPAWAPTPVEPDPDPDPEPDAPEAPDDPDADLTDVPEAAAPAENDAEASSAPDTAAVAPSNAEAPADEGADEPAPTQD